MRAVGRKLHAPRRLSGRHPYDGDVPFDPDRVSTVALDPYSTLVDASSDSDVVSNGSPEALASLVELAGAPDA